MKTDKDICVFYHMAREFCNSPIVPKKCPHFEIDGRQCKSHGFVDVPEEKEKGKEGKDECS